MTTLIFAFTPKGFSLTMRIVQFLEKPEIYLSKSCMPPYTCEKFHLIDGNLKEIVQECFNRRCQLLFIGAIGIAVRSIAPYIRHKTEDPAVLSISEDGSYVIPLLSGHIGGANELARQIAALIGATPIITTATDQNNLFAVDVWAVQNHYHIVHPEAIKYISSALLRGESVGFYSDYPVDGPIPNGFTTAAQPEIGLCICRQPCEIFSRQLTLKPKCYHLGIGSKKNVPFDILEPFVLSHLQQLSLPITEIRSVSSIILKKEEPAILQFSRKYNVPFTVYEAAELQAISHLFSSSPFVEQTTGVGNVCEAASWLSAKQGELILAKTKGDGVTLAIAKENWRVCFETDHDRY